MALSTATITFDLADWVGDDLDARRTKGWITTNAPGGYVTDTIAGKIRIDDAKVTVNTDGTGSVTVWVPGADANPETWQTTFHFDVPRNGRRDRKVLTMGPFTITASADLATLIEEQVAIPTATASTYAAAADASADAAASSAGAAASSASAAAASEAAAEAAAATAVDVSNIDTPDALVATLVSDPVAGPETTAALSATIVEYAPSLVHDFTVMPNTADLDGTRTQTGHVVNDHSIRPSGKFYVQGGVLISMPEVGQTNAGYLGSRLPGKVRHIWFEHIWPAGGTSQIAALMVSEDPFTEWIAGQPPRAGVHYLIGAGSWGHQWYDNGPHPVADGTFTPVLGVNVRYDLYINPTAGSVRLVGKRIDSQAVFIDQTTSDSHVTDWAGNWATFEHYADAATPAPAASATYRWGADASTSPALPASQLDLERSEARAKIGAATQAATGTLTTVAVPTGFAEVIAKRGECTVPPSGEVILRTRFHLTVSASGDGVIFTRPISFNSSGVGTQMNDFVTVVPTLTANTGWHTVESHITGLTPGTRFRGNHGFILAGTGAASIKHGSDGAYARYDYRSVATPAGA